MSKPPAPKYLTHNLEPEFIKNFPEIILKQKIRVTRSKNTFPKEMAIIKMCKEKRRKKVKRGHSFILAFL